MSIPEPADLASPHPVDEFLAQLVGRLVHGGCDDCGAYQTVHMDPDGVWHVTVHHDDWCRFWASIR
jgi:hypothetical protein